MLPSPVTHVIFDLDGLLLNTEDLYTQVFDDLAMRWVGRHFDLHTKEQMMGRRRADALTLYKDKFEIPLSIDEIDVTARKYLNELLPTADLMPGAERLVSHLFKHGIPMAIATGSDTQSFAVKTSRHKAFFTKHFEHVVLSSDPEVKNGKPEPDIFLIAAERFKSPPSDYCTCIVFEDAPLGVQGALAAGMSCVWVPSIPSSDQASQLPAHVVLTSLEHFSPEYFGLPPYSAPSAPSSPSSLGD